MRQKSEASGFCLYDLWFPGRSHIVFPVSYISNDNPEQRVKDIDNVLTFVRKKYGYKNIIVIGGSEGSLVASILSSRVDYLCATVLFGVGGRYFLDDVIHSIKFTSQNTDTVNRNIEGFKQLSQHILTHVPFQFSMSNHGYTWWRSMLSFDREMQLFKIKIPVLVIQGGADQSASPEKATEMYKSLQEKGKNNIEYKLYPEYNHSLNLTINDNSADIVIANIKEWLEIKVGR